MLTRIFHAWSAASVRRPCSAGFQACGVADFPVGRVTDAEWRQRVGKPATQQTWKSAPRLVCEISGLTVTSFSGLTPAMNKKFLMVAACRCRKVASLALGLLA